MARAVGRGRDDATVERTMPALGYRPALDGLRGVAILLVIGQHATVPLLARSGSVGVTLFFVLSGFLITTLLLEERQRTGRIHLWAFYQRRARRLLPALFVFLAAMALLGVGLQTILPALFYYANWAVLNDGSMVPIGHTWSLSIEEQFYIAWPLLLIGVLRFAPRLLSPMLVTGIAAAVMLRAAAWVGTGDREWTFFATQHRADALLVGCLLAVVITRHRWIPGWPLVAAAVGGLALASIIPSHGFLALVGLTLSGASSVVLVALGAAVEPRALTWRPLVYVGIISYALYLWHGPLLRWAREADVTPPAMAGAVLLAFVLAALSRRYVEAPFLRGRSYAQPPLIRPIMAGVRAAPADTKELGSG